MSSIPKHSLKTDDNSNEEKQLKKQIEKTTDKDLRRVNAHTSNDPGTLGAENDLLGKNTNRQEKSLNSKTRHKQNLALNRLQKDIEKARQNMDKRESYHFLSSFKASNDDLSSEKQDSARKFWLNLTNFGKILKRHKKQDEKEINLSNVGLEDDIAACLKPVSKNEFESAKTVSNWKGTRLVTKTSSKTKVQFIPDESKLEVLVNVENV